MGDGSHFLREEEGVGDAFASLFTRLFGSSFCGFQKAAFEKLFLKAVTKKGRLLSLSKNGHIQSSIPSYFKVNEGSRMAYY